MNQRQRTCWNCGGKGYIVDWFAGLFSMSWADWQRNSYKRCPGCSGRGWYMERWIEYTRRYGRRR